MGAADDQRRVRPLHRRRGATDAVHPVIRSVVAHRLAGEQTLDDPNRLDEPIESNAGRIECHSGGFVVRREPPRAHPHEAIPMKQTLLPVAVLVLTLSACNQQPADKQSANTQHMATSPAGSGAPFTVAPAAGEIPAAATTQEARKSRTAITADEIAQIKATGKTGLWADQTAVCAADAKKGIKTTLTWNVEGADRVVIYAINAAGKEKRFGKGGPVGRQETGPWLRPGVSFKIRAADTNQDLGKVEIGEKPC